MSEDQYLGNLYQRFPVTIEKGLGSHVWDTDNKEYIDCMVGYGVALVVHRNERVVNEIKTNSDLISPNHVFKKGSWSTFIKKELTDRKNINILGDVPEEYLYSPIELVGESYTDKGCCLTEKVLKPLYYKKPFISMASKGYHTFLKNQGFYLYDELFDYSFDNSSFKVRFNSIMDQIKNILNQPTEKLKSYRKGDPP